ncbi:MAG: ABC transporter ATP-binding protein, partial [Euryarchaeota archaeon]
MGKGESTEILIEVKGLKKWFPIKSGLLSTVNDYVKAVDDIDLQIKKGETLGIVGESGCGKTTLGRVLLGLIPLTEGEITYNG